MSDGGAMDAMFGGGDPATPPATPPAGGGDPATPPAADEPGGGDPAVPPAGAGAPAAWYAEWGLSDTTEGDKPSDRQWLDNKGYKDPATLVKSYRALESKVGSALTVPKEGASKEEIESFHKALGRPDTAAGYEIQLPDGADLDKGLFDSFAAKAFELGVPKSMAGELGKWFVDMQLDTNSQIVSQRNQERDELFQKWGAQKDINLTLCNRAAAKLGLDRNAVGDMQKGFGAGRTLELLRTIGAGIAEDSVADGGPRGNFGITAAEAEVELRKMEDDQETRKLLYAKDPTTTARRQRLIEAIAAGEEEKQRAQR